MSDLAYQKRGKNTSRRSHFSLSLRVPFVLLYFFHHDHGQDQWAIGGGTGKSFVASSLGLSPAGLEHDAVLRTPFERLGLIRGPENTFFIANLNHCKKLRLMRHIKTLEAGHVVLDLGSGSLFLAHRGRHSRFRGAHRPSGRKP